MAKRIGEHFRGNVVGYVALFMALGMGTAYALDRNSVESKHIAPAAVKLSDTNDKLRLKCPTSTAYFEGACIERAGRAAAIAVDADLDCAGEGRRIPTVAELEGFRKEPGITLDGAYEWTSAYHLSGGSGVRGVVNENETAYTGDASSHTYRCVARAKR